ncbi:MAG: hypothetical protein HY366_00765 [Candidatus Aenigmarchaeota archaeon]|nr:hypothetical protein [Candidatus Aenigmarchaeota archaeon]
MAEQAQETQQQKQKAASAKTIWKGKEWYELVAPKLFGERIITETPASDVVQLTGRTVVVNAATLTGNPSKYYYKIRFRVSNISGRRVLCEYDGHECSRDFVSRMIRRRSRRIDTRDVVTLQDGKRLVVKVIGTTIRTTKSTIESEVAKKVSASVAALAAQLTLEAFVTEMLAGNLQKKIQSDVSKIYPLREVEINKTDVLAS